MARDLAPLITGATILDAWWDWPPVIRHPAPERFRDGLAGRTVEAVSRRAKWLVIDLDDAAVLAIQVKMTGQLFVLPEGTTHDRHVHLRLTLDAGPVAGGRRHRGAALAALPGHAQVRTRGPLPPRRGRGRPGRRRRGRALRAARAGAARRGLHAAPLPRAPAGASGPPQAASSPTSPSWPGWATSTPTRPSGVRGCTPCARWRSLRPQHEKRLYAAIREVLGEAIERRGSSVDDYTAPEGDGEHAGAPRRLPAHRPALPPLRPAHPPPRAGAARDALLLVVPAPAGTRPPRHDRPPGGQRPARGAAGSELVRARGAGPRRATDARARDAGRVPGARARRLSRASHVHPAPRGRAPRDRRLRHPRLGQRHARARRAGRPGGRQRCRQDDPPRDHRRSRGARRRRHRAWHATRASGCSPRRRTSTAAFSSAPSVRAVVRGGAAEVEAMERELATMEAAGAAAVAVARLCQPARALRGARRLSPRPACGGGPGGPGHRARALAPSACCALRRRADARGAGAPAGRRPGPAPARRADQPPRHRGPRVARGDAGAAPGQPAGGLARPGLPGQRRRTRLGAARPAPGILPGRLLRVPAPAGVRRRPGACRG